MSPLLLLVACQSTPTVPAIPATHAIPMATSGRPMLHIRADDALLDGAAVTVTDIAQSRPDWPDTVLVAIEPDVAWSTAQSWLDALPGAVERAALVVSDATPQSAAPIGAGGSIDITWLDEVFAIRTQVDQPLITGGETRLLGTLSGTAAARVLAGPQRTAAEVFRILDAAHGQDVGCLRTAVEVADTQPGAAAPSALRVPVSAQMSVLPLVLSDASCPSPMGRLPAVRLQAHTDEVVTVDGGPLDALEVRDQLDPSRRVIDQCLGLARDDWPDVAQDDAVTAIAQVDIGADGAVVGTRVMVAGEGAQARDVQERCVARILHQTSFDTQGQRARFLLTVAP